MLRGLLSLGRSRRKRRTQPIPKLIGHSHAQPVFDAAIAEGFALGGYNFWSAPQPALSQDRTALHPDIAACLAEGTVFSMVGGAVHNIMGLVRHPVPFDFVLPERPDLPIDSEARMLPVAAVGASMMQLLQEYLDILALVRLAADGPVYHIEPPPPFEDGTRLLADVPWMFFQNLTSEVSPAPLRYKLWKLATQLVQKFCQTIDIEFVSIPDGVVDGSGYLRPDFYGDAMHVNRAYGVLVLDQIRALDRSFDTRCQ